MTVNQWELENELKSAVRSGDIAIVERLLRKHPDMWEYDGVSGSWLHMAARSGDLATVELLIALGADVNRDSEFSGKPILLAARKGHLDVVKCLLNNNAVLSVDEPNLNTLIGAVLGANVNVVECLLDAGLDADICYRSESGELKNALTLAVERHQDLIAAFLRERGCQLPVEGVDIPVNEVAQPAASASQESDAVREILDHMTDSVGPIEALALQEIVPVDDDVHVAINVIRPNENCPFTTLFTTGMSEVAMNVPEGQEKFQYAELVMYLPGDWQIPHPNSSDESTLWPFQWLRQIAYYPHLNETWLGGAHTIISSDDPPAPLGPGTDFTCLLLNADMMEWSPLELSDGRKIRFYTVMPIYTEERDFEVKHGIVPLLQRFEEIGIPPTLLPERLNVAKM